MVNKSSIATATDVVDVVVDFVVVVNVVVVTLLVANNHIIFSCGQQMLF